MAQRSRKKVALARQTIGQDGEEVLVPKGYTARKVAPAKNYDVLSMARAMNDDLGGRVERLFRPEKEAALEAAESGVYVGWRLPEQQHDCQRIGPSARCFCFHSLREHRKFDPAKSDRLACRACPCKAFAWCPSRPEEVGEFWFQRRRDFRPDQWRLRCTCKHAHEQHDPNGLRPCRGCRCGEFRSSSVCAACDRPWQCHETFFETEAERRRAQLPVGEDYLPFAEVPSLRKMMLKGEDDGDASYVRHIRPPYDPDRKLGSLAIRN